MLLEDIKHSNPHITLYQEIIFLSHREEGRMKEVRYEDNNVIISDSTLQNILLYQLKNMIS